MFSFEENECGNLIRYFHFGLYNVFVKLGWPTVVEDDPKAPFLIVLHGGIGEGAAPFSVMYTLH